MEVRLWSGLKHSASALEAYVSDCRLVEWRAISLVGVTADGTEVIEHDGTPDDDVRDPVPYP